MSIYDPTTGICYNRYFPLDLQPLILTSFIHGINDETIADATHMTQEELNQIIDYFHLKDRVLLSYSGGKGTFDPMFVQNYCKRHGLTGFENLNFKNIKNKIPKAPFGTEGQLTKDNLCRMFGIDGVSEIHTSYNDCILEWKLFEKLDSECVFFIEDHLFKYTPDYIIPVSYLTQHPELAKYANINIPHIKGKATEIFKLEFPDHLLKEIKKFPTNITGVTIEHGINSNLKAEKQNNIAFLITNKSHLKYVGSLDNRIKKIPIIKENDGTVKAINKEEIEFINEVNDVTSKIITNIKPLVDYLKANIFKEDKIMTQELSISDDKKVLALCDLSDSENVVEIKTMRVVNGNGDVRKDVALQLFYQAKGRNAYILSIDFLTEFSWNIDVREIIKGLDIYLYKVDLSEYDPASIIHSYTLNDLEIKVLKLITKNPNIFKTQIASKVGCSVKLLNEYIVRLEKLGYIKKEKPQGKNAYWLVLRKSNDIITNFTFDGRNFHFVKNY